jgi:hypothetical protein
MGLQLPEAFHLLKGLGINSKNFLRSSYDISQKFLQSSSEAVFLVVCDSSMNEL